MVFAWDDRNHEHIAKHGVTHGEAEEVVRNSKSPCPMEVGEGKLVVWGFTAVGRHLQVIYVLKKPDDVEFESLPLSHWVSIAAGEVQEVVRVIHAMELTPAMKKRLRKRRRR
jgi:uncharacterized DUF497 family protein